jgi:hypothetical protein
MVLTKDFRKDKNKVGDYKQYDSIFYRNHSGTPALF